MLCYTGILYDGSHERIRYSFHTAAMGYNVIFNALDNPKPMIAALLKGNRIDLNVVRHLSYSNTETQLSQLTKDMALSQILVNG